MLCVLKKDEGWMPTEIAKKWQMADGKVETQQS